MLEKLRKFSGTIFAKLFLFIVAIPFIFWGMGDIFSGGNINTIVQLDKTKISAEKFINYIKVYSNPDQKIDSKIIESLLSSFIGEKLIEMEVKKFDIKISDKSLAQIIKNQKMFMKQNIFSRTEYEKFLIKNGLTAARFEKNVLRQEQKKELLRFIGGGLTPPFFIVNHEYDKINQKRDIDIINLDDLFKQKIKLSEQDILSYYNKNKNSYKIIYKIIKFIEITPISLIGIDDYNDSFFKKIDQIDDLIVEDKSINFISKKFNLEKIDTITINEFGKNKNNESINNFPKKFVKNIFNINISEKIFLLQSDEKYFVVEIFKTENIQKKLKDIFVEKDITNILKKNAKRKIISRLITKINNNKFSKTDFVKISNDNNILIRKINLKNLNDDSVLKKELVSQVYLYPKNKVIIATDIGMNENFLVYIDDIKHVNINRKSNDYNKYLNLSKLKMKSDLYNTYDTYLKRKYKIKINYKSLDNIKNYF